MPVGDRRPSQHNAAMISLLLATMLMVQDAPKTAAAPDGSLRVGTFNIRLDTPKDGDDGWPHRKEMLFRTVRKMDPDVIGFQEVLANQFDALKAALPAYEFVGVGRNDGKRAGEFVPVAFKRDRLEKLAEGHFWLSETPETPGSRSWDAKITRMVTWVRLKDRANGKVMMFVNTHFDHIGVAARAESAKLLRTRIAALREGVPAILVGDFNTAEETEPYVTLRGTAELIDSFREVRTERGREEGTFNGFKGERTGARIDWILHTPELKTLSCEIVRDSEGGRYPSDHFPVQAVLAHGEPKQP
jgi:endonuclease/exonuclease/phosphatase family metal-dependent hydrolase